MAPNSNSRRKKVAEAGVDDDEDDDDDDEDQRRKRRRFLPSSSTNDDVGEGEEGQPDEGFLLRGDGQRGGSVEGCDANQTALTEQPPAENTGIISSGTKRRKSWTIENEDEGGDNDNTEKNFTTKRRKFADQASAKKAPSSDPPVNVDGTRTTEGSIGKKEIASAPAAAAMQGVPDAANSDVGGVEGVATGISSVLGGRPPATPRGATAEVNAAKQRIATAETRANRAPAVPGAGGGCVSSTSNPTATGCREHAAPATSTTTKQHRARSGWSYPMVFLTTTLLLGLVLLIRALNPPPRFSRSHPHIIVPHHHLATKGRDGQNERDDSGMIANVTLREFLSDEAGFHLAMAPAFFGFYGYFGSLAAWEDGIGRSVLENRTIRSVAGGSAGAMAAVLLAAGVPPRVAADFCAGITLDRFADFPGKFSVFRGNLFEGIMKDFLKEQVPDHSLTMEDAFLPVAVSAFDISTMRGRILRTGSMARAARASATFPFLFEPVAHQESLFIDGGVTDPSGLKGLEAFLSAEDDSHQRVVNLVVGDFLGGVPPGPSSLPSLGNGATSRGDLLSISIRNLPNCGPWAMSNGPRAVDAAYQAMLASLDVPLHRGRDDNHFELHIDTLSFQ